MGPGRERALGGHISVVALLELRAGSSLPERSQPVLMASAVRCLMDPSSFDTCPLWEQSS